MRSSWLFASGLSAVAAASAFSCTQTPNTGDELTVTFSAQSAVTVGVGGAGGTADEAATTGEGGMSVSSSGAGGTMGMGGMGQTSTGAMSSTEASTGIGGFGGMEPTPVETPVHGCLFENAYDLTGGGPAVSLSLNTATKLYSATVNGATIEIPYPMCIKIKFNQRIALGGPGVKSDGNGTNPLMLGGTVDQDGIAKYDKQSPIQPSCYSGGSNSFDPNSTGCYSGGTWPCGHPNASTAAQCSLESQKAFVVKAYPFYDNGLKDTRKGALYIVP